MNDPNKKKMLLGPRAWRANRLRYPGWTIAPRKVRTQVWDSTENWVGPITSMGEEYSTFEKLFAFRELNWRLELVLFPMFPAFARAAEKLLSDITPKTAKETALEFLQSTPSPTDVSSEEYANLPSSNFDYEASDIQASWKELAFGMLRFAREERKLELFENWIGRIKSNLLISPDESARICYEQSLWGLANLDSDLVVQALRAWPEDTALSMRMHRVSILLQVGEIDQAAAIATQCYERIQKTARNQHANLSLVSIEAWNVMVLSRIQEQLRFPQEAPNFDAILLANVQRRIDELARMKYDPWQLLEQFQKVKNVEPPTFEAESQHTGFHPGENTTTYHFGQNYFKQFQPAYEVLRFSEEAPFPPRFPGQNLCVESIRAAATWLIRHDPIRSDSILFHLKDEKFTQEYLSRHRVAAMPEERLQDLYQAAKSGLDKTLNAPYSNPSSIEPKAVYIQSNIKTALEIISRLVIRMPQAEQLEILYLSMKLYKSEYISRIRFASDPLKSLFRSLFHSLPANVLTDKFPEIAQLPIPGTKEFPVFDSYSWPYLLQEFSEVVNESPVANPCDWTKLVENMLTKFDEGNPGVRIRALRRLDTLYRFGCMTQTQVDKLGRIYWKDSMGSGIPHQQPFHRQACLALPSPATVNIESRFKEFVLSFDESTKTEELVKLLRCWIYANRNTNKTRHTVVRWSTDDLKQVMTMIELVWQRLKVVDEVKSTDTKSFASWMGEATPSQMMQEVTISLRDLIIAGAYEFSDRLNKVVNEIHQSTHAIGQVLPVLSLVESDIDVESEMRLGLASHHRATYVSCLSGLLHWAEYSGRNPLSSTSVALSPVPVDIVRELGVIVANRRQPDLEQALSVSSMLIRSTTAKLDERFLSSVLFGLSYLLHELEYSFVENKNLPFNYHEVPKLRRHAARIAVALKRFHAVDDKTVDAWIELAKRDPLPEIRKVTAELSNQDIVSIKESIHETKSLYSSLQQLMRKHVSKKEREHVQQLLTRIEIDIVEQRETDVKTIALAVCNSAKVTLVSKANAFSAFVSMLMPEFTLSPEELKHISVTARADDCSAPDDTLDAIQSAIELKAGAMRLSSPKTNEAAEQR